jgi:DNA-directed RNA polymerase subunit beta'
MNTQQNRLYQKIQIGVASPKQIRSWAERFLPSGQSVGEVTSWETVNYKTLKPEPDGLFCQKIFGPVVDFSCACAKKSTKIERGFCKQCGVERTHSRVRRYRLGYIKLKQPVVHPLYASHRPSSLALCLNWTTRRVQNVIKTLEFCCLPPNFRRFPSRLEFQLFFQKLKSSQSIKKKPCQIFSTKEAEKKTTSTVKPPFSPKIGLTPRLFTAKKQKRRIRLFLPFNMGGGETRLYGIAYDATWRQVEEFQEFLFYVWEQSFSYEFSVPYYALTKQIEKHNSEIPKHEQSYAIQTGGFVFQQILSHLDIKNLHYELASNALFFHKVGLQIQEKLAKCPPPVTRDDFKKLKKLKNGLRRIKNLELKCKRQRETFRDFELGQTEPAWMVLSYLPVLPPGLRPITSIRGELIVSDINDLYRKVLIRNNRVSRGTNFGVFDTALSGSWLSWCYNVRQVQEAVDELLKKGHTTDSGKHLKSLLEGLKGKQGRFRQNLLGKRVDYSGRSVIVVGPKLKIHQCGLPKQMAVQLFQPFIIQKLRKKGIVFTTTAAKALIAERKPIVWSILTDILQTHPILLNRAPTLHRLGIQAFLPQLVEGKAILLHPLVCPAFNADFDGDQMAVHVPLSATTRAEALGLLWSRNHLLAPSSGQPLLLPTQDMVLGFYYLTCSLEKGSKNLETLLPSQKVLNQNQPFVEQKNSFCFSTFSEVLSFYDRNLVTLQTPIWVKSSCFVQTLSPEQENRAKENLVEIRLDGFGRVETLFLDSCQFFRSHKNTLFFSLTDKTTDSQFVRTTPGRVLMYSWISQAR